MVDTVFTVSDDGYVRLLYEEIQHIFLTHFISGLDEDMPIDVSSGAVVTAITGYTEWITVGVPVITVGWDWQINVDHHLIQICRISEPRCNVMLLDSNRKDLGFTKTSLLLEIYIDSLKWQLEVKKYLHIDCVKENLAYSLKK